MNLWPFQERTIETLRRSPARRIGVCAPTGAGKSIMMGYIAHSAWTRYGLRSLLLAHRLELVDQSVTKIQLWGDIPIGVMRADDERTNPDAPIQVATIQTLARRRLPSADIVLSDEFHHDCSEGRRNILNAYPEATILGWSATPVRTDNQPLKELYDTLVTAASYSELIAGGFIAAPVCYSTPAVVDLSQVKTVAGDYAIDGLDVVMNEPHVIGDIVKEWQDHAEGRATVVFACTIKHSLAIVARFIAAGIRAEHLDGTVEESARRACLRRLRDGLVQVVVQCNVLTEGFDEAAVKCLVLARPTQSLGLYMQAAGRVMRPYRGIVPVLLDHSGNLDRHGLPHEDRVWSLFDAPRLKAKSPYRTCPKCYAYVLKNPCELCGYFATPEERQIREKLAASRLVERGAEDVRRLFFVAALTKAKAKGYRPEYASAKYKEKFGEYPPWSWSQEAKQAMDPQWAARIERQSAEREHWKRINEGSMTIDVPEAKERSEDDVMDEIEQGSIPF